ncbi:hypothetical protein [Gemmatimonas sp.]|uniref:hypothetical protein n=1 Tax=Gemmatimonas sp. TaxID=1962908 RepID=UPI003DA30D5B
MSSHTAEKSSAAARLAERLQSTTVTDLKADHPDAYATGEKVAADELSIDELKALDTFFAEHVDDVAVSELDEEALFDGLANAVGLERARDLLKEGHENIEGVSKMAVFLLGIVDTWREADV